MHRLAMLQKMGFLLITSVTVLARVGPQAKMDIVPMPPEAIGEVEDLVTIGAWVAPLVEMGGNVVL